MSTLVWHVLQGRQRLGFRVGILRWKAGQHLVTITSLALSCAGWVVPLQGAISSLQGELSIHDPSTIVKCKDSWWVFGTGWGIGSKSSKDLLTWKAGPRVFAAPPSWTTNMVPGNRGYFWAPDVVHLNGRYLLYYSVSTWGSQNSVIGLATNQTLEEADPQYSWKDEGTVIRSSPTNDYNAIDPSVFLDNEKRLWLAFGSYWSGIKLTELDPETGKQLDPKAPVTPLAWHSSIEAPCVYQHGGDYYLFVNWGQCCRGTNSTYSIRVGRAKTVYGPYLDKTGTPMMQDGGTLLIGTAGRMIGPGHAAVLMDGTTERISFDFYDGDNKGRATLALRGLNWGKDGWPEIGN